MARLPPSRHPLHCSLRIPDLRARNDSRRSCHHALPAICLTRRLSAQTIRRCGLNATFRTRLQRCDGDWWPLSSRRSRVVHAAPLGTRHEVYDTVRLDLPLPKFRDANRRCPRPRPTAARYLDVDEVRLPLDGCGARSLESIDQLCRLVDDFAAYSKTLSNRCHIHIRPTQVIVNELLPLHHFAARDVIDHTGKGDPLEAIDRLVPWESSCRHRGCGADEMRKSSAASIFHYGARRGCRGSRSSNTLKHQLLYRI